MLSRRGLITGLISLAAAPAIVRASSLMPVKVMEPTLTSEQILDELYAVTRKNMNRLLYGDYEITWTGKDNIFHCRPVSDQELLYGR